ncbi:MAG TPA: signal peptidase I [Solirubrobacteraceae bacterium]|nr:signal peptidase I [Solirubrobacteraceae bacterium]
MKTLVKRIRSRVAVLNGTFLLVAVLVWFYLAPASIGGFTTYVVTHGISMEPRFHTGDLALVRPADHYEVGDIVAYHSSLLHEVVLHRIVAIHDGRYTFKGDNNSFLDPVHPARSQLVGKLWIHLPRAGALLTVIHTPVVEAVMCGLLGLLLVSAFGEQERRRRRRRQGTSGSPSHGRRLVNTARDQDAPRLVSFGAPLAASAVAAVAFLLLAGFAFTKAARRPVSRSIPYTQRVTFGYSARVPAGPVYPNGRIKTNDPIFLTLVRRLDVHIAYQFRGPVPSTVTGTEEVILNLIGPSGWTRSFVLTPRTHFAGAETTTEVTLNLSQLEYLIGEIEKLTGTPGFGSFSLTVQPVVHTTATVAGHPITASYEPALGFQLQGDQLQPASGSSSLGSTPGTSPTAGQANYTPSQTGSVATPGIAPGTVRVLGVLADVTLLRWISILGLLLSAAAALFLYLRKRAEPFQETAHIQSHYGHLIVPIVAGEDLGWPAVDVPTIKALAKLAESGQRLILHSRTEGVDTYMVNDEGTVYRYQVRPSKVIWGEWSEAATPVKAAA